MGDEGSDVGLVTLMKAGEIAKDYGVELDIDGPTEEEWNAA